MATSLNWSLLLIAIDQNKHPIVCVHKEAVGSWNLETVNLQSKGEGHFSLQKKVGHETGAQYLAPPRGHILGKFERPLVDCVGVIGSMKMCQMSVSFHFP